MNIHRPAQSGLPDRQALVSATAPIAAAAGLPNWLYCGDGALEGERRKVFAPNWAGIGFTKDVPERGDVRPVTFLGEPMLLARDRDGEIRVFQNTCRHRGVVLVEEASNTTGLIRCPYHAWCYSLKGELKQTPHAGGPGIHEHESVDKSKLGLIEIRSHVYLGVIFVNLSGDAEPFETHFATLLERWRDYDKPSWFGGDESAFTLDVATNWKLAVENYCESYHLPFIHPGLNSYSRLEDHANILGDGPWSGQLTRVYNPKPDASGKAFPQFAAMPERWDTNAEYLALYPNVLMGVHKDHTYGIVLEPVTTSRTLEHVAIFYSDPDVATTEWSGLRQANAKQWEDIFIEDVGVVESMQRGRKASAFDGGHFSAVMDESTHHFHSWIANCFLQDN